MRPNFILFVPVLASLLLAVASPLQMAAQNPPWTIRHQRAGGFLWSITSNESRLVTVGTHGRILISDDGVVWNERSSGVTDWLVGVAYGGGRFIAVGDSGRILTSPNGDTWSVVPDVPTTARLNTVLFNGGPEVLGNHTSLWVAVGESGTALVSRDNGVTWRAGETGASGWLRGLTFLVTRSYRALPEGDGTASLGMVINNEFAFVACGQGGKIITSPDGLAWTALNSGTTEDLEALTGTYSTVPNYPPLYNDVGFNHAVAVGGSGVVRNYDGPTAFFSNHVFLAPFDPPPTLPAYPAWTAGSLGVTSDTRLRGLANNTKPRDGSTSILLASGENGLVIVGNRQQSTGVTQDLVASVYHRDKFYIVGQDETILQQASPALPSRIGNLSTRASVGGINNGTRGVLIGGVSIAGNAAKRVLVRAIGPSLSAFNVPLPMSQPTLTGFDASGHATVSNSGWADDPAVTTAARDVGAFPLAAGSKDAAIVTTLSPGNHTFLVQPAVGTEGGTVLFEIYDIDAPANANPRLANVSSRGFVGSNDVLIGGFVVTGASSGNVLLRGVGPTLANFGVTDAVSDCSIAVYRGDHLIATNDDWGTNANATQLAFTFTKVGAFELASDSKDAALLLANLAPGNYTVVLAPKAGTAGTGLVEIYELP